MLMWIWIAVVVLSLIVLAAVAVPLLGRLRELSRAVRKLRWREAEVAKLQVAAAALQERVADVQRQAATVQERIAGLTPDRG